MRILLFCMAVAWPFSALADEARFDGLSAQFGNWLSTHDANGVLAVFKADDFLGHAAHGMEADAPVETASLSKAITAVCAQQLVAAGKMDWEQSFAAYVPGGPDIAVGALVAHAAGLGPDDTQLNMWRWLDQSGPRGADVLAGVLQRKTQAGTSGVHGYNNENYALLGLAIEAAAERPYAEVCNELVVKPAGAKGALSDRTGAFAAWGGWAMTTADYARTLLYWYGPRGAVGQDPMAAPHVQMDKGLYYGLGMMFHAFRGGHNFWHIGALCFPGRLETGTYAVTFKGDWTLVAAYDRCVDQEAMFALDQALALAVFTPLDAKPAD